MVMLNSTSKKIFKYFPLPFTDSNTSDLLFLLMVFFVSQQRPMCHDQLYKIQLRKKYNMLSLSSFSFCKIEKSNVLFASQFENSWFTIIHRQDLGSLSVQLGQPGNGA